MVGRTLEELRCRNCGAILENTAGGNNSLCPNYHGKLQARLSRDEVARVLPLQLREVLPVAIPVEGARGRYRLNGRGEYRRKDTITARTSARRRDEGRLIAACDKLVKGFGEFENALEEESE